MMFTKDFVFRKVSMPITVNSAFWPLVNQSVVIIKDLR
jgi:hypothetical protein